MEESKGKEKGYKISNISFLENKTSGCCIKTESNGEIVIKENNNIKFENLFLPRKLKNSVLVVDLPFKVKIFDTYIL